KLTGNGTTGGNSFTAQSSFTCNFANTAGSCGDSSDTFTVAAGDTIDLSITPANTPAAATIYISAVWKPTSSANYGQFIVTMAPNTAIVNGATEYQTLTGLGNTQSATESSFQQTVSAPSG